MDTIDKFEKGLQDVRTAYAELLQAHEDLKSRSVSWHVDDFEGRAKEREERNREEFAEDELAGLRLLYDRDKFKYALERMINKHDAEIGITWETIDFWLDEMCPLEIPRTVDGKTWCEAVPLESAWYHFKNTGLFIYNFADDSEFLVEQEQFDLWLEDNTGVSCKEIFEVFLKENYIDNGDVLAIEVAS